MQNIKKENSVRSLVSLYTVVIGVALAYSVTILIDTSTGLTSISLVKIFLFISFIVTLFPFFHGALRHLDDAYLENENPNIKNGALIIDFVLLFFHALAFVILSLLIDKPTEFAYVLVGLISIDVLWGVFAYFGFSTAGSKDTNFTAELKWTIINIVFVFISGALIFLFPSYLTKLENPLGVAFSIMAMSTIRSLIDYIWCKDFYFP